MELEELKNIWKNKGPGFQPKDEAEIALMLKGTSQSIVTKLKRSTWFELIFTVVVGIALLVYAMTLPAGAIKWLFVSLLVMLVAYSFYYVKKLILLNQFSSAHENIRANLEKLVDNLTSYLKFYKRSYTILYPLYFILGLLFAGIERGADDFFQNLIRPKTIISLVTLAIFFYFSSTFMANWYLKKLYGNHLEKLKGLLSDLSE